MTRKVVDLVARPMFGSTTDNEVWPVTWDEDSNFGAIELTYFEVLSCGHEFLIESRYNEPIRMAKRRRCHRCFSARASG